MESTFILKDLDGELIAIQDEHVKQPLIDLSQTIASHYNVNVEDMRFRCDGIDLNPMEDKRSLEEINPQSKTVNVLLKVAGGKVHGSLSRAGKVRGQTPKVAKQDKKKKLTGRAARRQQYIKRFRRAQPSQRGGRRR